MTYIETLFLFKNNGLERIEKAKIFLGNFHLFSETNATAELEMFPERTMRGTEASVELAPFFFQIFNFFMKKKLK